MPWATIRAALIRAVLAGAVVGSVEGGRALWAAPLGPSAAHRVATWAGVSALACVGASVLAVALSTCAAAAARGPWVAHWMGDLASGGRARTLAAWRGALAVASIASFALISASLAGWALDAFRFRNPGPFGLLVAGTLTPVAAAIVAAAVTVDRWVAARIATATWSPALLAGRRMWVAAALAVAAIALGPPLAVHRIAPAVELAVPVSLAVLVAALTLLRIVRASDHRVAATLALAVTVASIAGVCSIPLAPHVRGTAVAHGAISRTVFRALSRTADRDDDGYAPAAVGGADCDDGDPGRNPTALEVAGNGADENCTGEDADPASFPHRRGLRPSGQTSQGHNVVLISIDALRADRLGSWGYTRPTSPHLDALAAQGARFEWAFTSSPTTRHAIPSMLTGRYAGALGRRGPRRGRDHPPTVAQVLADAGWDTAAITCCARFGRPIRELSAFAELDASADATRLTRAGMLNGDVVADRASAWLRKRSRNPRPFLLWLHFYDPHHPYATPRDGAYFGDSDSDRYDAEIAFADHQVGRILDVLDETGLAASTIVTVTADHGEEFGEHGIRFHARSLFNQVIRIPLIVRYPGASATVVDSPVSLVDVAPTLIDLVGLSGPSGMNGYSLADAIRGVGPAPDRPVLIELIPDRQIHRDMYAIAVGHWKLVWDIEADSRSLFSLTRDPRDSQDESRSHPVEERALFRTLLDVLDLELAH